MFRVVNICKNTLNDLMCLHVWIVNFLKEHRPRSLPCRVVKSKSMICSCSWRLQPDLSQSHPHSSVTCTNTDYNTRDIRRTRIHWLEVCTGRAASKIIPEICICVTFANAWTISIERYTCLLNYCGPWMVTFSSDSHQHVMSYTL